MKLNENQSSGSRAKEGRIRLGIVGYGNLGRGAEYSIAQNDDMELKYIFTRREPTSITPVTNGVQVLSVDEAKHYCDEIDVMLLCGGSATDLPIQTPEFARLFNVVDSYDNHAKVPEHFSKADEAAKSGNKTAIICVGWDPGVFSLNRVISEAILPHGNSYTFWGEGVSQGHSDVLRRVAGVVDARQYTIPIDEALEAVRNGENPELTSRQKHKRVCYVVAKEGADLAALEREIVSIPNYFAENDTIVNFISSEELARDHFDLPHGGFVIHGGKTGQDNLNNQIVEYSLKLDSNPEFTVSTMVAYARAAYRLYNEGSVGCKTIFDIPPSYISPKSAEDLRKNYL